MIFDELVGLGFAESLWLKGVKAMAFEICDHEYTMFEGALREDYLIAMLGCQVVFVSAVRKNELSTKVLEVRDVYCGPMGTRTRWELEPLGQGNGQGQRARQRDWEKEAKQWTWGSAKLCVGVESVNLDRVV